MTPYTNINAIKSHEHAISKTFSKHELKNNENMLILRALFSMTFTPSPMHVHMLLSDWTLAKICFYVFFVFCKPSYVCMSLRVFEQDQVLNNIKCFSLVRRK